MAQVEFVDGAVCAEGTDYELVHGNGSHLRLGKLRAHVPKVAVGFTVDLPLGEVVDLGLILESKCIQILPQRSLSTMEK